MSFFGIIDYKNRNNFNSNNYLQLKIDADMGVDVVPDMTVNITNLNKKEKEHFKHYSYNGYGGITFKVVVLLKETDVWDNKKVIDVLHEWFINLTPLAVVTQAIDIPDGRYLITKNNNRKQTKKGSTVWELEFTTYTPYTVYRYKNNNANVLKALTKIKNNKKTIRKKNKSTINIKLKKCNYKILVYSKKRKNIKCVKYMQKILYKQHLLSKKQIDGWFGLKTKSAVKKFQKKYNKTHMKTINVKNGQRMPTGKKYLSRYLSVTGKVDKATWKALCEV